MVDGYQPQLVGALQLSSELARSISELRRDYWAVKNQKLEAERKLTWEVSIRDKIAENHARETAELSILRRELNRLKKEIKGKDTAFSELQRQCEGLLKDSTDEFP